MSIGTASGTTTGNYYYSSYCGNRLPCGICRITNAPCPTYNGWGGYPYYTTCGTIKSEGRTGSDSATMKDYPKTATIEIHNWRNADSCSCQ